MTNAASTRSLVLIWLVFGLIAASLSHLMRDDATAPSGEIVPMGNDAFYHAERMTDTAGEYGFYQFDTRMHVPDGSWVTWPWAYDYLAGIALKVALSVNPTMQPMAFLGWLPVLWVFLNMALLIGITSRLGLNVEIVACAALAFSLSPAVQALHGFAIIDHHYIELSLVLGSLYALMRWLGDPRSRREAIAVGVVLGIAPAFHTSAFIFQLLTLVTLFLLWLRRSVPDTGATNAMSIGLAVGTLIAVLPSEPLYDGQFTISTLSWFHVYVALCTVIVSRFLSRRPAGITNAAILAGLSVVLLIPLAGSILLGSNFLSGNIMLLDRIEEMKSPFAALSTNGGWQILLSGYSGLVVLVPLLILAWVILLIRERRAPHVAFFVSSIFGLALLALQSRLVYFGLGAMIVGTLFVLTELLHKRLSRPAVGLLSLVVITISVQPQLRGQLFGEHPLGLDRDYEMTYDIYSAIGRHCADAPGLLIAGSNDGHPARYHSDCSVLSNNFILTEQHEQKGAELISLLSKSPAEFLRSAPQETQYLLLRLRGMYVFDGDRVGIRNIDALRVINPPLFMQLAEADALVPGFELLAQLRVPDARDLPMVQLYRVTPAR